MKVTFWVWVLGWLVSLTPHAEAGVERFIIKDKTTTVRVMVLDGDRAEERTYDPHGFVLVRWIDLGTGKITEPQARTGLVTAAGDEMKSVETPIGHAMAVVRKGSVIARVYKSR